MPYKFACSQVGFHCPFVAEGDTEQEVIEKAKQHGRESHGLTEEQLKSPEMTRKVKAAVKKT
jgi:predicted small metal-binding protein